MFQSLTDDLEDTDDKSDRSESMINLDEEPEKGNTLIMNCNYNN